MWLRMGIMWDIQHLFNTDSRNTYRASSVCQAPEIQPYSRQTTVPSGDSILAQKKWHHSNGKHWEQPLSSDLALENILCYIMILNERIHWASSGSSCLQKFGPGRMDGEKQANNSCEDDAIKPWLLVPFLGPMPSFWLSPVSTIVGSCWPSTRALQVHCLLPEWSMHYLACHLW